MKEQIADRIARQMGMLFSCAEWDGKVRIRTPYMYPDGDVVDLYLGGSHGDELTDLGETLRWLRMQSVGEQRTRKQQALIQDVCQTLGLNLSRGMLSIPVRDQDHLSEALVRLGQGAVRIADLWFTFRSRVGETVTDEVAELLRERSVPFERSVRLQGRSGRSWTIDFRTERRQKATLICVLATGSRGAARGIAEHVVATWHDLSHLQASPSPTAFVSLFDDTTDVWTPEDFRLVESLSSVSRWSRADELVDSLVA